MTIIQHTGLNIADKEKSRSWTCLYSCGYKGIVRSESMSGIMSAQLLYNIEVSLLH